MLWLVCSSFWVSTTTTVVVNGLDCGCPTTCTPAALGEMNDSNFVCRTRIQWMMAKHSDSEFTACKHATKGPAHSDAENAQRPCRYEACHPTQCGDKLKAAETAAQPVVTEKAQEAPKKVETPVAAEASTTTATTVGTSAQAAAPKSAALPQEFSDDDNKNNNNNNNNNNKNTIDNDDDSKKLYTLTISMAYAQGAGIVGLLVAVYCWISSRRKDDKDGTNTSTTRKAVSTRNIKNDRTSQRLSRLTRRR
jgi:hypothetical protein